MESSLDRRKGRGSVVGGHSRSVLMIFGFLLICSATLNFLTGAKLQRVNNVLRLMRSEARLAAGAALPPVTARNVSGHLVTISYDQSDLPTVLYIFSPLCGWCTKNTANIKALADQADKFRLIALSLSPANLREYVLQHSLNFPVYEVSADTALTYRLGTTPQTIVVSPEGQVLRIWDGAYEGELKREIENYLKVRLPGIAQGATLLR